MTDIAMEATSRLASEDAANACEEELLQMEALLFARAYLYELFSRLVGGTPDRELLDIALSETTRDVLEEFSDASDELEAFASFLSSLRGAGRSDLLDAAKDEHTRIFIGPTALPASPYESPYTGSHDAALFQENTLKVRNAYRAAGLAPRRVQAIPDDHIAMMLAFMASMAHRSRVAFFAGHDLSLGEALETPRAFVQEHMGGWLDVFAESVRNSKAGRAGVLYPQLLEAVAALAKADVQFLTEAAYWTSGQSVLARREGSPELAEAEEQLARLQGMSPLGIADFEIVEIQD